MVLSIISSVYAVPWFVFTCITSNTSYHYSSYTVIYGIQILISLIESVIAITASGYSCRVFCCGKVQNPGTVLYSPGQGAYAIQNPQTFMVSPGAVGYQNPVMYSQQMATPQMAAPQIATPQMAAPQMAAPQMAAPQTLSNQNEEIIDGPPSYNTSEVTQRKELDRFNSRSGLM